MDDSGVSGVSEGSRRCWRRMRAAEELHEVDMDDAARGGLVAAIKSMKPVRLREVQLYERNVHDLRTNHAEVWENLKDVLREKE